MDDNAENEPVQQIPAATPAPINAPAEEKKVKVPIMRSLKAELVFGEAVRPPAGHDASYSNQKSAMGHEVFCVRYSPDGQFIAASRGDGNIDVYSTGTGNKVYHMAHLGDGSPTCSIRFRPNNQSSKTRNVLTSASANGEVKHWHMTSMKCLHTIVEKDNQVFALDYRFDGLKFATAGSDYKLRIYDESTKSLQATLTGGYGRTKSGHSNRVFSVKFSPDDDNVVLSAGWDNTVQIWDIRMDSPVRSCFGCHVTGDALDLYGNSIITGSWRPDKCLQEWDFRSTNLVREYTWNNTGPTPSMLYAAQYSKDPTASHVVAGGSGSNEARVFERESGNLVGIIRDMAQGVYSVDCHPTMSKVAIGSGDGTVRVVDYKQK